MKRKDVQIKLQRNATERAKLTTLINKKLKQNKRKRNINVIKETITKAWKIKS